MVQFNSDIGTDVFLRGIDAGERARKVRQSLAVDAAVRRGLSQSMGMGADGVVAPVAPVAPALAPTAGTPPAAPAAPAAQPPAAGAQTAAPAAPALAPTPASTSAASAPPAAPAFAPPTPAAAGGDRYEPVLRELAGVEGGGAAALGVMQQQQQGAAARERRQDQLARLSMYAYGRGDSRTGDYFADQAGIPRGAAVVRGMGRAGTPQDTSLLGRAMTLADSLYGTAANERDAARRFTLAYIDSNGDMRAAMLAAAAGSETRRRQLTPAARSNLLVQIRRDVAHEVQMGRVPAANAEQEIARRFAEFEQMITGEPRQPFPGQGVPPPAAPAPATDPRNWWQRNMPGAIGGQQAPGSVPPPPQAQPDAARPTLVPSTTAPAAPAPQPMTPHVPGAGSGIPQPPPAAAPAAPPTAAQPPPSTDPPRAAIDRLRANPALAPQFDQWYGPGAAAKWLGGA
jgi:hypothetical protein